MSKFKFGDKVQHEQRGWGVIVAIRERSDGELIYDMVFHNGIRTCANEVELTPYTPPPPEGTIPVRIAVGVDRNGDWSAAGWFGHGQGGECAEKHVRECWEEGGGNIRITFVTAHVPLPQPPAEVAAHAVEVEGC